jgi:hypothetical protein
MCRVFQAREDKLRRYSDEVQSGIVTRAKAE